MRKNKLHIIIIIVIDTCKADDGTTVRLRPKPFSVRLVCSRAYKIILIHCYTLQLYNCRTT